jgi:hypothetical protein
MMTLKERKKVNKETVKCYNKKRRIHETRQGTTLPVTEPVSSDEQGSPERAPGFNLSRPRQEKYGTIDLGKFALR